ncbi:biosynthetic-type acetolactate synthase large subunit [Desulfurispira natronophila]|uniref:Acetolactate synthase n=1 Tax=Desulfurispira natronophila TaxID=682562 RepID=A0A7W7Y3H7_9BACT|nr:biosynthetic-type acetolactate synthase large subunit [Desulfurispira natronophila]MBB5021411.1 acetolactate synthase-1/2/3 large subunit [Desulfurispira natronophila]
MKMTGAQIFVECLKKENVEVMFGYPGGVLIGIYDALYDSDVNHILTRHEQGAAHAADGYARSTGKVGVCMATSGPGATNLVTGIATAFMDSVPMVVFTGQVPTGVIGNDAFQEADIVGITRPIVKHNYLVQDISDLATTIKEAFHIASTGRPGPVLVDIPKDVIHAQYEFTYPDKVNIPGYKPTMKGHPGQIKKFVELVKQAKRPLLYVGGGIKASEATTQLRKLAETLRIPVTETLMGLGSVSGYSELFVGMLGMHGCYAANTAVSECDLVIAVGARFDDRVTGKLDEFAKEAKVIHIDIDPSSISKSVLAHHPIVGDVREVLESILKELERQDIETMTKGHDEWIEQIHHWQKQYPLTYAPSDEVIKPQFVLEELSDKIKGRNAIVTTEVGQHQMWAAQFIKHEDPRRFLSSGGLGTMGYGFPAAIGAAFGNPTATVIDVAGDGSIQMNIQEMIIAVQHKLNVKILILNNGFLGMVRQWQQLFFNRRYSNTDIEFQPDFVKLGEAYGAKGLRADKPSEVGALLDEMLNTPGPVIADVVVDREENVMPMVPAGASVRDMILTDQI